VPLSFLIFHCTFLCYYDDDAVMVLAMKFSFYQHQIIVHLG